LNTEADNHYFLKGLDAEATGEFSDKAFIVKAGSLARKDIVASFRESAVQLRKSLLAENVLEEYEDQLRFTQDYLFNSPSGAAAFVLGRPSNGWIEWTHSDGRTLSEVRRVTRPVGQIMLSESKRLEIVETFERLIGEGRVYTETQLEHFCSVFREKFGPAVLKSLDGEALLNLMHDLANRDSLVYWLEYKNDDEFNTKQFGSIAGGSSLKYRIFRRKETGEWQAGSENNKNKPVNISLEQAIDYAREHRDQLLSGVELLEQLPENATDDDYALLQDQMDELAPDVSRLGWGHKYFSILFPEKLDNFHLVDWQHFNLLKFLQLPPEDEGRYISAGRFVSAANETGLQMYQFVTALYVVHKRQHRYWRVGTKDGSGNVSHWETMQQRNSISGGWHELGDLSWFVSKKDSLESLKKRYSEKYPESTPQVISKDCSQVSQFIDTMKEGDVVVAVDGATILGIGRVVEQYRYDPTLDFPHERPVEWLNLESWKMPIAEGLGSTIRELKRHDMNIVEIERRIQNAVTQQVSDSPNASRSIRLDGYPGRIQSVLDRKGQVILYGPPGTGKTYWAERAVNDLAAISAFGKRYEDLTEQEQLGITGDGRSLGYVRLCCFHPAYGYEDFIEGYRPQLVNNQMTFELRDGVFKKLCDDAANEPDKKFYLIVDEINRGDIPRIFGELLTTLEKDKRGKRVVLPVSQGVFNVPSNVYLVGTMNTADRSISLLDAALRRRFGFIELMPDGSVLKSTNVSGIPMGAWFNALNERIRQHVGRDARNLQIGHSYLMHSGSPIKDIAALKRALRHDIIPLLEEYCYEDYNTLESILGTDLVDAKRQGINQELFEDGQEENLVQGILSSYSEIMTSSAALESEDNSIEESSDEDDDESEDASTDGE